MGKKIMVIDMTGKGCRHRLYGKQLDRTNVFRPQSDSVRNAILTGAFAALEGHNAYFYRNKNVKWVTKVKAGEITKLTRPGAKNKSVPVDCTGLVTAICKYAGVSATRCASYDKYMNALTKNGKLKRMSFKGNSSSIQPGDVMVRKNGSRGHAWVYVGSVTKSQVMDGSKPRNNTAVSSSSSSSSSKSSSTSSKGTGAQAMVATAKKELGTREKGNNDVKYNTWYWGHHSSQPWCAAFICWCAYTTFGKNWTKAFEKTALAFNVCQGVVNKGGKWLGKAASKGPTTHVGLIASIKNGVASTVEGNSGPGTAYVHSRNIKVPQNAAPGDLICFYGSSIGGIARPKYPGGSYPLDGSGGSADGAIGVDSGGNIILTTIDQLYSTDKYKWFTQEEEETEEEKKFKAMVEANKTFLTNISVDIRDGDKIAPTDVQIGSIINSKAPFTFKASRYSGKSGTALLTSYPSFVEAPTIELSFNGITIGGYGNTGDKFPNYITSMSVKKINGKINYYSINLVYQIRPGEDPNFIDALLSRTGYTNPLKIRYGDASSPGLLFKEERAVITDVKSKDNVASSTINYTIEAVSSITSADQSYFNFKEVTDKPSTVINNLLYSSGQVSTQLLSAFPAMKNRTLVSSKNLIPSNDSEVTIGGMANVTPITYLSHAVSCMTNAAKTSSYFLTYNDSSDGAFFKVSEIAQMTSTNVLYEVDVGYPGDNFVMNFQLCDNMYWPLVYEYNGAIPKWNYDIDNNGNVVATKSNALLSDNKYLNESIINSNWWKSLTEFPISAKLTLKGLTIPAMLMTYIRINTLFYGQKDIASGVYVVTDQTDSVSGSGYTTTLTLLRVCD